MKLAAAALVLVLSGCAAGPEPVVWLGDEAFGPCERAEIERGVAFLGEHAGPAVVVSWTLPHDAPPRTYTIRRGEAVRGIGHYDGALHIVLDADAANESGGSMLARLAAHELGHWLGLAHVEGEGSIMSAGVSSAPLAWTAEDRAAYEKGPTSPPSP